MTKRHFSYIHVGFTNTGTTTLQRNFFSRRDDIFYVGEPYREYGGLFSLIRYVEDFRYDERYVRRLCRDQIWGKRGENTLVISDETMCDSPQIYFSPYLVPRDLIAQRLFRLFSPTRIIFTIRNQKDYVESMYLNLKRNSAFLSRMPVPPLSQWYNGMLTQIRCNYLQNLNFWDIINFYENLFGRENILVLPLELAITEGPGPYLHKLCNFMGIPPSDRDVELFAKPQNVRMSARKALVAELLQDDRFFRLYSDLERGIGAERFQAILDQGEPASASLADVDLADLRRRVATGNRLLADAYDLDLERYGYAIASAPTGAAPAKKTAAIQVRRAASADQIEALQRTIVSEREASTSHIKELQDRFDAERQASVDRITELEQKLAGNSQAFLDRIGELQAIVDRFGPERRAFLDRFNELQAAIDRFDPERHGYLDRINELQATIDRFDPERHGYLDRINELQATLDGFEPERRAYLDRINELQAMLDGFEPERRAYLDRINELQATLDRFEPERRAYLDRINELQMAEGRLDPERKAFVDRINELQATVDGFEPERQAFIARINELQKIVDKFDLEREAFIERINDLLRTRG